MKSTNHLGRFPIYGTPPEKCAAGSEICAVYPKNLHDRSWFFHACLLDLLSQNQKITWNILKLCSAHCASQIAIALRRFIPLLEMSFAHEVLTAASGHFHWYFDLTSFTKAPIALPVFVGRDGWLHALMQSHQLLHLACELGAWHLTNSLHHALNLPGLSCSILRNLSISSTGQSQVAKEDQHASKDQAAAHKTHRNICGDAHCRHKTQAQARQKVDSRLGEYPNCPCQNTGRNSCHSDCRFRIGSDPLLHLVDLLREPWVLKAQNLVNVDLDSVEVLCHHAILCAKCIFLRPATQVLILLVHARISEEEHFFQTLETGHATCDVLIFVLEIILHIDLFIWWWLIQSLLFFRQELHCYVEAVELPPECHLLIGRKHVYFSQGGWSSSEFEPIASSQLDSSRSYIYIWILSYRYILLYIYISHDPVQIPRIFPWIFQHFPSHKSRASGCVEWHPSRDVQKRLSALVEPAVFQLWKMDPWCPAQKQLRQLRSDRSFFSDLRYSMVYPLVNCPITMGNHHFQWVNPLFLWPFSIAILT